VFSELLESDSTKKTTHKSWAVALSGISQGIVLAALILIPLLHSQALEMAWLRPRIFAPVPLVPQPPPSQPPKASSGPRLLHGNHLIMPPFVPARVNIFRGPELPPEVGPGGQSNSIWEEIPPLTTIDKIAAANRAVLPPTTTDLPSRVKRGGDVEQARLIEQIKPIYPLLAKQTHTQGVVVLHAIIGKDGEVAELQLISGHPLLVRAAMEAVRQWRYRSTLLNGEPVEVDTTITVTFRLTE
jgi:periplasmic protein TonB